METNRGFFLGITFWLALWPLGCSYQSLTTAETDVVLTLKDEGRDYAQLKTYALAPEVIDLCQLAEENEGDAGEFGQGGFGGSSPIDPENCFIVDHSLDQTILSAIEENLEARGYRRIFDVSEEAPDMVLISGIVARNNWFVGYGWCNPYYYSGCWYPSYSYSYNLPTGTILIQALDVEQSKMGAWSHVWTAAVQGLYAESFQLTGEQRVEQAIEQAFTQSTYLVAGGEE